MILSFKKSIFKNLKTGIHLKNKTNAAGSNHWGLNLIKIIKIEIKLIKINSFKYF